MEEPLTVSHKKTSSLYIQQSETFVGLLVHFVRVKPSDNIMRVVWYTIFLLLVLLTTVVNAGEDDDYDKRCRYFSLFKACKIGCKVLGHTTGSCDQNDKCHCSEEDFNLFDDVSRWFDELPDVGQVLSRQVNKFKRRIDDWELDEKIKKLTPSKCQISQEFCSKACHSIGRVSGVCNEDFTDCDCSDEYVSAKQYGLCAVDSICKYDCQRRGYARGECVGKEEWECECISANDVRVEYNFDIPEETTPSGSPEYENVETFDA